MKKFSFISTLLLAMLCGWSQTAFNTVVTEGPVLMGESFRVQYVLDELASEEDFVQPKFIGFRVVSGPQFYEGITMGADGPRKMRNVIYTIAPLKPGKFAIPGASARVNGKLIRSNSSALEVISRDEAVRRGILADKRPQVEDYYLKAGEDPYKKISRSLFLRVLVDRKTCYVGQPVVATFKLYSTLESRSDIVKNPGLYGFTVQDIIGLQDNKVSVETINGKNFDVHTIRKVQMYPLRPGSFEIDPMEVRNKVEFYTSSASRTPEQTIREGVIEDDNFSALVNTVVYETSMSTEPVKINVLPAPELAKPEAFSGATGKFSIESHINGTALHTNQEAVLEVRIKGAGNFTQLGAPEIRWPEGITAFDPEIRDDLDPATAPLQGERLFRYHFLSTRKGTHVLPAVTLAFFNPDSNRYQTVSSSPVTLTVTDSANARTVVVPEKKPAPAPFAYGIISVTALLLLAVIIFWLYYKRTRKSGALEEAKPAAPATPSVEQIMSEASMQVMVDDRSFCMSLRKGVWNFFSLHFGLSGSQLNRVQLNTLMRVKGIHEEQQDEINRVLDHCDTGMFTTVSEDAGSNEWLNRSMAVLKQIESQLKK